MRATFLFIICLIAELGSANTSVAKEWRGIKPLSSTRADVERLLGIDQLDPDAEARVRSQCLEFIRSTDTCSIEANVVYGSATK